MNGNEFDLAYQSTHTNKGEMHQNSNEIEFPSTPMSSDYSTYMTNEQKQRSQFLSSFGENRNAFSKNSQGVSNPIYEHDSDNLSNRTAIYVTIDRSQRQNAIPESNNYFSTEQAYHSGSNYIEKSDGLSQVMPNHARVDVENLIPVVYYSNSQNANYNPYIGKTSNYLGKTSSFDRTNLLSRRTQDKQNVDRKFRSPIHDVQSPTYFDDYSVDQSTSEMTVAIQNGTPFLHENVEYLDDPIGQNRIQNSHIESANNTIMSHPPLFTNNPTGKPPMSCHPIGSPREWAKSPKFTRNASENVRSIPISIKSPPSMKREHENFHQNRSGSHGNLQTTSRYIDRNFLPGHSQHVRSGSQGNMRSNSRNFRQNWISESNLHGRQSLPRKGYSAHREMIEQRERSRHQSENSKLKQRMVFSEMNLDLISLQPIGAGVRDITSPISQRRIVRDSVRMKLNRSPSFTEETQSLKNLSHLVHRNRSRISRNSNFGIPPTPKSSVVLEALYLGSTDVYPLNGDAAFCLAVDKILSIAYDEKKGLLRKCVAELQITQKNNLVICDNSKIRFDKKKILGRSIRDCKHDPNERLFSSPELSKWKITNSRIFGISVKKTRFLMTRHIVYVMCEFPTNQANAFVVPFLQDKFPLDRA